MVGFPRESRISRAWTSTISAISSMAPLCLPAQDEVAQCPERLRRHAERREGSVRLPRELGGARFGGGESVESRVGGFPLPLVLPGRLPERLERALDVEDVVDDLEREADPVAVLGERRQLPVRRSEEH